MGSFLDGLIEEVDELVVDKGVLVTKREDMAIIERYKEAKEKGECIEVTFTDVSADGELICYDEMSDVTLKINGDNMLGGKPTNKRSYRILIGVVHVCTVISVNEEDRVVYLSSKDVPQEVKNMYKRRIEGEIRTVLENLKEGQRLILPGKIVHIEDSGKERLGVKATVNLLGKGIYGVIHARYWGVGYTDDLHNECKVGEYHRFEVVKKAVIDKKNVWVLSRVNIAPSPWNEKLLEEFPVGSAIQVKCTSIPKGKTYWWGESARFRGAEIMCDYNDKLVIAKGASYLCKVRVVDVEKRLFMVAPFKRVDSEKAKAPVFVSSKTHKRLNDRRKEV